VGLVFFEDKKTGISTLLHQCFITLLPEKLASTVTISCLEDV
jgi:hypothetical protein